jgi:hypothetical protein
MARTVLANRELLAGTVPANKELLAATVLANNLFLVLKHTKKNSLFAYILTLKGFSTLLKADIS